MGYGRTNVSQSAPLTNYMTKFAQDASMFIADKAMPIALVNKEIGKFYIYGVDNWVPTDAVRAPGTESNQMRRPIPSLNTYSIEEYALHDYVPTREVDEADVVLQPRQDCARELYEALMINKEQSVAGKFAATASFLNYTSLAAASQWGYTSTTTPIDNIQTGFDTVQKATGKNPNKIVMGGDVWTVLRNHGSVLERIKYSQVGIVTEDLLAAATGVQNILIGKAVYGTGKETAGGMDSQGTSYIWGKNVSIIYSENTPNTRSFSFGYQLSKRGGNIIVKEEIDTKKDSYWIETSVFYDAKVTAAAAGYNIFGAVA